MKNARSIFPLIAAAILVAAFGYPYSDVGHPIDPSDVRHPNISIPISADSFLDPPRFEASANASSSTLGGRPVAGVVNHHVLASDLMARFMKTLKRSRPDLERIIILSPDHFKRGTDTITVGTDDFVTAGQIARVDREAVERLVQDRVASRGARSLFEAEHGVGALIPFLGREFPDVRIVPIILRADVPRRRAADLGRRLAQEMDETTVIVVSSDMSHYLSERDALENDVETLRFLEERDRTAMARANDDFTDNGPAFVALFALFEEMKNAPTFTLIDHTISTRYGGPRNNTTSYLNGFWE